MEPRTLQEAILYFDSPKNCREYLVERRWPHGVVCPKCGSVNVLFLEKYNRWHCRERHPSPQFTLKTGTVMEDSPIGLDKWLTVMWMVANSKSGISSWEIHRAIGVTQKTAWFLLHRVRLALGEIPADKMGRNGPIEVDETHVGPKPQKMHRARRNKVHGSSRRDTTAVVMGLLDRESRQVRAKVVPNVKRETLLNEILNQIEGGATVYTDGAPVYDHLAAQDYIHATVNHVEE